MPASTRTREVASYEPSPAEQDVLEVVQERREIDYALKRTLEKQWRLNIAFLTGHQYHRQNAFGNLFFRQEAGRFRAYEIRNFIRPYNEKRVASFTSFRPRFRVRPESEEVEDKRAAECSTDISTSYWDKLDLESAWHELMHWVCTTGNGFFQVFWDSSEGDSYADEHLGENGERLVELIADGDVRVEVVSPFQISFDPLASKWDDVEWVCKKTRRTLAWIGRHFPDKLRFVANEQGEGDGADVGEDEDDLLNLAGISGFSGSPDNRGNAQQWAVVEEYWEKKSQDYPNGRLTIICGSVVLRDGDNPNPKGMIPFVMFRDLIVPGRVWGQSLIDCMIPMQRNYNRIASKMIEHIVLLVNGKILSPSGAGLMESAFTTEIGEVIEFAGMQPPTFMEPPSLPNDLESQMMLIKADMDLVTSQFGPARGQYQGKLSGRAIDILVEQDFKSREPILARHARGLEKVMKLILLEVQEHVTDERVIKITGKRKQFSVKFFRGADINGATDVTIDVDSVMPKSRTMALSMVQALTGSWLMPGNPDDRAKVFEALQLEDDGVLVENKGVHARAAELETKFLSMGIPIEQAQWYEDQEVHLMVHTEYMASDEFKMLPPMVRATYEQHVQTHLDIVRPKVGATVTPDQMEPTEAEGPERGGAPAPAPAPAGAMA